VILYIKLLYKYCSDSICTPSVDRGSESPADERFRTQYHTPQGYNGRSVYFSLDADLFSVDSCVSKLSMCDLVWAKWWCKMFMQTYRWMIELLVRPQFGVASPWLIYVIFVWFVLIRENFRRRNPLQCLHEVKLAEIWGMLPHAYLLLRLVVSSYTQTFDAHQLISLNGPLAKISGKKCGDHANFTTFDVRKMLHWQGMATEKIINQSYIRHIIS